MTIPSILSGFFSSIGQTSFTAKGTYNFIVPQGVFQISAVCVGGGGCGVKGANNAEQPGGGGGGLRWISGMPVTPGETLTVFVGYGGTASASRTVNPIGVAGTWSYIARDATILIAGNGGGNGNRWTVGTAIGGTGGRGIFDASLVGAAGVSTGGGDGGKGGNSLGNNNGGGGGAGGYTGNGGPGVNDGAAFVAGTNGGAGGGAAGNSTNANIGGGGGGVGIDGSGTSGTTAGASGSAGANGGVSGTNPNGGRFGGGGGGLDANNDTTAAGNGGDGAVRIIWGLGRAYPTQLGITTY